MEELGIQYKIEADKVYEIHRQDHKDNTFYSITVYKTNPDGLTTFGKKIVRFKKDVDLKNNTKIRILKGFEDFYQKDRYNTMFTVFIEDFEIVNEPEEVEEAYKAYNAEQDIPLPF